MTKNEFIRKFAEDYNTTQNFAKEWVNKFFDQLAKEIVDNKRLEIRGLGIWKHQFYPGRTANNFATGQKMKLDDTMGIKFQLSQTLVDEMREIYPQKKKEN